MKIFSGVVKSAVLLAAAVCLPATTVFAVTEQVEVTAYATTTGDFGDLRAAPGASDTVVIGDLGTATAEGRLTVVPTSGGSNPAISLKNTSGSRVMAIRNDGAVITDKILSNVSANPILVGGDVQFTTNPQNGYPAGILTPPVANFTYSYSNPSHVNGTNQNGVQGSFWTGTISGPIKGIVHVSFDMQFCDGHGGGALASVYFYNDNNYSILRMLDVKADANGAMAYRRRPTVTWEIPIHHSGSTSYTYHLYCGFNNDVKSGGYFEVTNLIVRLENVPSTTDTTGWLT